MKKYKIISKDLQKNLIDFLDEIQFDAAKSQSVDDMHKINFCNWAINELLNGYDAYVSKQKLDSNKKPKNKRPGRHSKRPNKHSKQKRYRRQGRKRVL